MVREKLNGAERERLAELGLTEEETESCEVLIFQAGEYICREGAALDRLLLVDDGGQGGVQQRGGHHSPPGRGLAPVPVRGTADGDGPLPGAHWPGAGAKRDQ